MEKIKCPACSGPDNAMCATCSGTNEVTQEAFNAFNENKQKLEELFLLRISIDDAIRNSGTKEELIELISAIIN
jgi:hypothetical protein